MGWNSWNTFGRRIDEITIRQTADSMASSGLRDRGYTYIVIDDCWSDKRGRDSQGNLVADPGKFPSGIKSLADYVHGQGFKFGIYSCAGEKTCADYPGSYGFEEQDAALWASWGVDFLKYDYCYAPTDQRSAIDRYTAMGSALRKTGRPIMYSICEWGSRNPHLWARKAGGHLWRVCGDLKNTWSDVWLPKGGFSAVGIDSVIETTADLHSYAGPSGWNDIDMLVVGLADGNPRDGDRFEKQPSHYHLSPIEERTHMSMWSILCSPLVIGCDVRSMSQLTADLLMNEEVIAINQDALGRQAVRVKRYGGLEVWRKPMSDSSVAVALVNRGSSRTECGFKAGEVGLLEDGKGVIRDVWKKEDIGEFSGEFKATLLPHECMLLTITTA
jgi:alpha-galactosidase